MGILNNYLDPIAKVWGYVKPSYYTAVRRKSAIKAVRKKVRKRVTKRA